jgi:hypothetical protein
LRLWAGGLAGGRAWGWARRESERKKSRSFIP